MENRMENKEQVQVSQEVDRAYDQAQDLNRPTGAAPGQVQMGESPVAQGSQAEKGPGVSSQEVSDLVDQVLAGGSPETARSEGVRQAIDMFNRLDVDTKLALLYYMYKEMGKSVTPAAPGAADLELLRGFFDQFNALPFGDAQLEAQRALVRCDDSALCREYGKLSDNNKVVIWFILAERMGKDVIDVPADYQFPEAGQRNLDMIKGLDYEQQITFLRDVCRPMGKDPIQRSEEAR